MNFTQSPGLDERAAEAAPIFLGLLMGLALLLCSNSDADDSWGDYPEQDGDMYEWLQNPDE